MAKNLIPEPNETKDCKLIIINHSGVEEASSSLAEDLLKLHGVYSKEDKKLFSDLIRKYDEKYKILLSSKK